MAPENATWNGKDSEGKPLTWDLDGLHWDGTIPEPHTKHNKMPILHVLTGFDGMKDHDLEDLAAAVSAMLYGNALFPDPPTGFEKAVLDAARTAFSEAIPIAKAGGPKDTADKNDKRAALIEILRVLAAYVQGKHGNSLTALLSTGFKAASTNRAQSVLPAPVIKGILNGLTGQLLPQVDPLDNAKGYEPRFAVVGPGSVLGPWQMGEFSPNARDLAINNLIPGTTYAVQVRAQGGSTHHSDWSDTVQHMAM